MFLRETHNEVLAEGIYAKVYFEPKKPEYPGKSRFFEKKHCKKARKAFSSRPASER